MTASLPPVIHIKDEKIKSNSSLKHLLDLLSDESRFTGAGAEISSNRLSEIIFVQAIRLWIKAEKVKPVNWLGALADESIAGALYLIHHNLSKKRIDDIASEIGMNRTEFADKFKRLVGELPITYMMKWRMNRAADHLASGESKVNETAAELGYQTSAAFSRRFKKYFGRPPREVKPR